MKKNIFVIGHRNPDTDSICSAISYAHLKNSISTNNHVPMRAGEINPETAFVLDYFDVTKPEYIEDVRAQIRDANYTEGVVVDSEISIREAWEILHDQGTAVLNVLDGNKNVKGLISVGDIAKFFMEAQSSSALSEGKTPFMNMVKTLAGKVIAGETKGKVVEGKVVIVTDESDPIEKIVEKGDIVLSVNDENIQKEAIKRGAACLIVCSNGNVDTEMAKLAERSETTLMVAPDDTFVTARLLNQSIPVDYFMRREKLITFMENEFIDDVKNTVTNTRHREFPILGADGKFKGVLKRENLINVDRKKVIMVDHNEKNQAVKGLTDAEIVEIVDHHKVGHIRTLGPVFYRNMPVGCTSTIVYTMYQEEGVVIPKEIAGLMCSAILSDTLLFKSPTCTPLDKEVAIKLGEIAGINIEEYAMEMFGAGSDFGARTTEEIFNLDYKKFNVGDIVYGVGQVSSVNRKELDELKEKLLEYMHGVIEGGSVDMAYLMLTDIMTDSSELLCAGEKALEVAMKAFDVEGEGHSLYLEGRVSRKKQIIPQITEALQ